MAFYLYILELQAGMQVTFSGDPFPYGGTESAAVMPNHTSDVDGFLFPCLSFRR